MENERDTKSRKSATDPIFKRVMLTLFQAWDVDIQTEVEVSRLPLRVDVIIRIATQEALRAIQSVTPFWFCLIHNILEFKGPRDPLTIWEYDRILARARLYRSTHKVPFSELTLTMICAQTPRKILSHPKLGFERIRAGYYFSDHHGLNVYLIAINELPTVPVNHLFLLFASSQVKLQEVIKEIVITENVEQLAYAYRMHPKLTKEISNMADKYTRNLEYIAQNMGQDLLPYMSIEDRVRDLTPAERLEGLTPSEQLQGLSLEDILDALDDEKRAVLRQLLNGQENGP
jgi:hypothetical protein